MQVTTPGVASAIQASREPGTTVSAYVTIEGVRKSFDGSGRRVDALDSVSLTVPKGAFTSIVGPSGCGKSTLLAAVAGLLPLTSGRIHVDGVPVTGPRADMAIMFQTPVLLPWRRVVDNVLLPVDVMYGRKRRSEHLDRCHDLLRLVGLESFAHCRPHELSGGMQQRVAICRSLITDPRLLLLDEPFGALDQITREQLNDILLEACNRTGITTILVTHDIDEAVYLSDEVVVMTSRPGRICGTVEVELPRPRSVETRGDAQFDRHAMDARKILWAGSGLAHRAE